MHVINKAEETDWDKSASSTAPPKYRVAVYAPSPIHLESLSLLVELTTHSKVVIRSTSSHTLVDQIAAAVADLVLLDEALIDRAVARRLTSHPVLAKTRVGIVATAPDASPSIRLACEKLDAPRFVGPREMVAWIARERDQEPDPSSAIPVPAISGISRREREVWRLIAKGLSVRGIAEELGLAESTIDSHKSRLMRKLRVHKSLDLVRMAVRLGMVEP